MDCSTPNTLPSRARFALLMIALSWTAVVVSGCSPSHRNVPYTSDTPAAISNQPVDETIPMGLSVTFAVTASGSSLQYQWQKDGAAIAGATSSSYVTPATTYADTGSSYTVTVSNANGMVTSNGATLTVTARAPMTGDLRFQQVDALSTVNGWGTAGVALTTNLPARAAQDFYPSLGTSFYVGSNGSCGTTPVTDGTGCSWEFSEVPLAVSSSSPTLLAGYGSDVFEDFQMDLQNPAWPALGNGASPASAQSVITALDLEPADVLFALSWVQSSDQTGFNLTQNTAAPAALQAAATQEGAGSRVITAISYNAGQITYLSYGWQADTSTIYESEIVTASPTNAPTAAAGLAAQGFIITATGSADGNGNVLLVGTRVQGDIMPRPFMAAQGSAEIQTMMQQGYANVGVILDLSNQLDPYTYLGER